MENIKKSLIYNEDCFPGYFRIKEVFEEQYAVSIRLPCVDVHQV